MDPTEALALMRSLAPIFNDAITASEETHSFEIDPNDVGEFVEAFQSLDVWISQGGFLPEQWEVNR